MSGTYVQCSKCGKRALSVATRCPQCGYEFPTRPLAPARRELDLRRYLAVLAVAGVAAVLIMLVVSVAVRIRTTPAEPATPVAAPGPDTAIVAASPPAPPTGPERRFARTWTKVRTRRTVTGDVVAVLLPGDTVLVDSLVRGWWRVTLDGRPLGYVHQSTLDPAPVPTSPPP
ncbi:MAG: SH3 domain-containing protein [Gemmatimonadales bacterium]